jgi:hypothetical protein
MKTCPRYFLGATVERHPKTGKIIGRKDAVCSCTCHVMLDKMFEMLGMERVIQDNPEYHAPVRDYWMPSPEERVASFIAASNGEARYVESPAPEVVPATVERIFAPTASGRSARGELELLVKKICDVWAVDREPLNCTPAYISEAVAKAQGWGKPPSQGAVNAVLERWVKLGFATIEKKPTRFTGYTAEGIRMGLDAMKLRAKDQRSRGVR